MLHLLPAAPTWRISAHARSRALERGICDSDLQLAAEQPDCTYPQTNSYGSDRHVYARGDWAIVVNPSEHVIITVLYRDHTRWLTTDRAGTEEHAHAC